MGRHQVLSLVASGGADDETAHTKKEIKYQIAKCKIAVLWTPYGELSLCDSCV